MKLKSVLLIGLLVMVLAAAYVWFFIYNKPKVNVEEKEAKYKITVAALVQEFETNHEAAWTKYNDQIMEVTGEVDRVEPNDSISSVIFKSGDKYEVFCEVYPRNNDEAKKLQPEQKIIVKGLFVRAEKPDTDLELAGVLGLKKSSFPKAE